MTSTAMLDAPMIPLKTKDLADTCRRVGTCLDAGVDIVKTWQQETERGSARSRLAALRVFTALKQGGPMSEALAAATGAYPRLAIDVVRVGEESGHVEHAFLQLAQHYDHQLSLRRMLGAAAIWPAISLALAILVIGVLILVLGFVGSMTGQPIDVLGFGLVGIPGFIKYVTFLSCCAAGAGVFFWGIRTGKLPVGRIWGLGMRIPALRSFVQATSLSRLAWALALGTNSQMKLSYALRLAFAAANNSFFERHVNDVIRATNNGQPIHEALRRTGDFPTDFVSMVEVGETSGRLPESLQKTSEQLASQARTASVAVTVLSGFLIWGFVACIIILLIFRLFSFYLQTIQEAGQI